MRLRFVFAALGVVVLVFPFLIAVGRPTKLSIDGYSEIQSGELPVALFSYSPQCPVVNETVMFNASGSFDPDGSIVSYEWSFGDGNVSVANDPFITHVYSVAHSTVNYTVILTVRDNDGLANSASTIVPITNPTILQVSIPAGENRTGISHLDPWLDECWLLNVSDASETFTVVIKDTSWIASSYATHLVIALSDAAYNNFVSLTVHNLTIAKSDFRYGTLRPYDLQDWPSGDVYPAWFNDTLVNVGTIPPRGHKNVTVSVAFSNATDARMHFDAYGSKRAVSPLFSDDFETGTFVAWSQVFGTASVVADGNVFNGTYKAQFSANGDRARADVGSVELAFSTAFICFDDLPSVAGQTAQFSSIGRYGSGWAMRAFIAHNGSDIVWRVGYRDGASTNYADSSLLANPSADAWHNVTIMVNYTSNTGYYKIWVNGTELTDVSSSGIRAFADIDFYLAGTQNMGYSTNVWMDDVEVETGPVRESYVTENPLSEDSTVLFSPPPVVKFYLTVVSPYGIPIGAGWYDNCTDAYAALDTGIVDHGNGTRRVFTNWSGDASGTGYASSNPIHMDRNKTATANWKTQYYLTLTTSPGGATDPSSSGWHDAGANVSVLAIPDACYLLDHWQLDSSDVGSANPYIVLMDEDHTLKAIFAQSSPPSVSISPLYASIDLGDSVVFASVVSGGMPQYTYQWYVDGNPVSSATSNNWIFTPTSIGVYNVHLTVTDSCLSVAQSDTAEITATEAYVGGHVISLTKETGSVRLIYYAVLVAMLTMAVGLVGRKKKGIFSTSSLRC